MQFVIVEIRDGANIKSPVNEIFEVVALICFHPLSKSTIAIFPSNACH